MIKNKKVALMTRTALFLALTCVATIVITIRIPNGYGYINVGDTVILIGALFLPPFWLGFAGGVGAMCADLLLDAAIYAPFTLVVKFLEGLIIAILFKELKKIINKEYLPYLISSFVAVLMLPLGYFFANWIITGEVAGGVADIPFELIQASASLIFANVLYFPLSALIKRGKIND